MSESELKWLPDDAPKNAAERREWPIAVYKGPLMKPAAYILSSTDQAYTPELMKSGNHTPLRVVILHYRDPKGRRMLHDASFPTVLDAIQFVEGFIRNHPEWKPALI